MELLIVAREFGTSGGPSDAVGTDKNGEIYIIETKLFTNTDRRHVVAQVLDYGASLWNNMDSNEFWRKLDDYTRDKHQTSLKERLQSKFKIDEDKAQYTEEQLKKNLAEGNFKFVVLLDKIESRLKDLIYFINRNSKFTIYPVEFEYYKFEDYQIIIPKIYGTEIKKSMNLKSSENRRQWDEKSFFEDAKSKLEDKHLQSIRKLYEFSKDTFDEISFGTGSEKGSFNPKNFKISQRSPYTVYSDGILTLNFGRLHDTEDAKKYRDEFKDKITKINGFDIPGNYREIISKFTIDKWHPVVDSLMSVIKTLGS